MSRRERFWHGFGRDVRGFFSPNCVGALHCSGTRCEPGMACVDCAPGSYHASGSCEPCPTGALCPGGTTLANLTLRPGYWRHSAETADVHPCAEFYGAGYSVLDSSSAAAACVGGTDAGEDGDGYCAPLHRGPLCHACAAHDTFFDSGSGACERCPKTGELAGGIVGVLGGALLLLAGIWWLHVRAGRKVEGSPRLAAAAARVRS